MPLSQLNLDVTLGWQMFTAITGFQPRTQNDSGSFAAEATITDSLARWNQVQAQYYTINPGATQEVDLYAFTNLTSGSVTATAALGIALFVTGGDVTISPGGTNPLNWFFNGGS